LYQYDNNGRLVLTSRPDGTEETRSYDASRMLTSINDTAPWGTIDANSITIDAAGRTTVENETTPGQPFTVPAAVSVTYDADNRLATVNGTAVTFDADGNMLSGPAPGTLANTGYSYNARNQLIEGADGYAYTYGVLDNRIGIQSPLNSFTTFVVDPHGALDRVLSRTVNDDDPLFNYLEQGDGMNLFSQTQDSFGAILKQQTQRDPRLSIKQMKQSASQASFKKRLLGGMLPPVLALLIIYFLTFLCELLIKYIQLNQLSTRPKSDPSLGPLQL
jgi:YD repeat-containing protein